MPSNDELSVTIQPLKFLQPFIKDLMKRNRFSGRSHPQHLLDICVTGDEGIKVHSDGDHRTEGVSIKHMLGFLFAVSCSKNWRSQTICCIGML